MRQVPGVARRSVDHLVRMIGEEERLNADLLHLTANESYMSETARLFLGSRLGDRYYMGGGDDEGVVDFGPFTFRGLRGVQTLVSEAEEAAARMLSACRVSLAPLSGIHAMMCAILSTTDPGDVVMSIGLDHGGHFATQRIVERFGRHHASTVYDFEALGIDVAATADRFHARGARALYLDASFSLSPHDLVGLRDALGPEAVIVYDASHTLGLLMGGRFQRPLEEGADVVCGNTHKTLPGPQKGLIAFADEALAERALGVVNSGLYSTSHTSSVVALAVTVLEMEAYGEAFADQVVANANHLAGALAVRGFELRSLGDRWTENHQVHLLTDQLGPYRVLYQRLLDARIVVNFDQPFGDGLFIRLGTQELTRRGMREREMELIAGLLDHGLRGSGRPEAARDLVRRFDRAAFSFDVELGLSPA